nr:hypothetical protein [Tanacetum cinerariifolium]
GLSEVEKKTFWDSLDKVVRKFPTNQRLILGGDLNGHIGAATEGYAGVHGGFGYGVRNEEGRAILDFAIAHDLVVVNSHYKKRDHHLKNLNGDATEASRSRVVEGVSTQVEVLAASDADSMWNILASNIKDAAKDTLGVAIGTSKTHTAWRDHGGFVKRGIDLGNICFIKDEEGRTITDEEEIKKRCREYFSSLFNARESEGREDVVDTKRLPHFDCYYSNISQTEMRTALQKMGRNKVIGLDQIPIEAWKSLGDEGIFWLTRLFNKIFTSAKMPEEWRLSEVIPIFKNKGYVQVCSNYR